MERRWTITDLDGTNPRSVTLAEFKAYHAVRVAAVQPVVNALRSGDSKAIEAAQTKLRSR